MRKIAVLASGAGSNAVNTTEFFHEGNRLRVDCLVTDRENAPAIEAMQALGVETLYFPRGEWSENPSSVADLLKRRGVDLLMVDDFGQELPPELLRAYSGAVVGESRDGSDAEGKVTMVRFFAPEGGDGAPREAVLLSHETPGAALFPRAVVAAFDAIDNPAAEVAAPPSLSALPPTPDKEWADSLHMRLDPEIHENQESATPPPPVMPGWKLPDFPTAAPAAPAAPPASEEKMPDTNMVWAILSLVFCFFIPAIVAIVYAARVSSLWYAGQKEAARASSRKAEIWIIVAIVSGLVINTFSLPLSMLMQ